MLVGLLVGIVGIEFVLERMNIGSIKSIESIHLKTRELKHKGILEYALLLIVGVVAWGLMALSGIGSVAQGVIVGVIWALIRFIFEDTFFDRARNTLR